MKSPEIRSWIDFQQIFNKDAKTTQKKLWCWNNWLTTGKTVISYLTADAEFNSPCVTDLNVTAKPIKFIEQNSNRHNLVLNKTLTFHTKCSNDKIENWKFVVTNDTVIQAEKTSHGMEENICRSHVW
jgi:hypothetical protein